MGLQNFPQTPKNPRAIDLLGAVPLGDVLGHVFKLVVGGPPRSLPADFCEVLFFNHSEGATSILRGCKDACLRAVSSHTRFCHLS